MKLFNINDTDLINLNQIVRLYTINQFYWYVAMSDGTSLEVPEHTIDDIIEAMKEGK